MTRLVFADAHLHSNPVRGLGAREIAKRFREKGGWFMALVGLSPWHYNIDVRSGVLEAYLRAIEIHVKECRRASELGLRISCFYGFHPADVDHLISMGVDPVKTLEVGLRVLEHVAKLCKEGILDGIGEVGRQHFTTSPEKFAIAYEILTYALMLAKDYDIPVHLHLENAGEITVVLVERLVHRVGVSRWRLLFHHSKPNVAKAAVERGFYATLPGKKPLLEFAFSRLRLTDNIMVESDFIDDPRRPCVSSCPWDVVETQLELMRRNVVTEEHLARINIDNIAKFYGVEPP